MTRLAVRMAFIDSEADVILLELAVAGNLQTLACVFAVRVTRDRLTRRQERIATFGAEEVLFVVRAFTKVRIVERDEHFINDRRLTMVAQGSKSL